MAENGLRYEDLFQRNSGIFTSLDQRRLKESCVLIVGCGGIGGTVAQILARTGVEKFILVEFDDYEPSNMNRQIGCFTNTLGRNKAAVVKKQILQINPQARVEVHPRLLDHQSLRSLIPKADLVFPAADDFAFSMFLFKDAQSLGKPSLLVLPSGTWANVCIINPDGPSVERIGGSPVLPTYQALKKALAEPKYKVWTWFFLLDADWRADYYKEYWEGGKPLAQICPLVWTASSIGAMEAVKVLTGKWDAVSLPRYWELTRKYIKVRHICGVSPATVRRFARMIGWRIHQTVFSKPLDRIVRFFMNILLWHSKRKERRECENRSL